MYLALKEIRHEKLRYTLITAMIVLISYLIFILSGLANGLASENTQAIESWHTKSVLLNRNANVNLSQSTITKKQLAATNLTKSQAIVGQAAVVVKSSNREKESAQFIGLDKNQYIAKNLVASSGRPFRKQHEVVVDQQFKSEGYKIGDKIKFNSASSQYTIVGFTKNAKLNIAPIVYGQMAIWKKLRPFPGSQVAGSAIISKTADFAPAVKGLKQYSSPYFISKLPGYSAQNTTFAFMIGFLMVISLVVIAVFLYILTIQALPTYAVLRAQGIPGAKLVSTIINQSLILMVAGIIGGALLTAITASLIPFGVPLSFNPVMLSLITLGLVVMGIIGAALPARKIAKIDPVSVIGG
ncbi:MAG: FtsX-like permease family protein [Oenococcus sp.]|uniref:ABC transporter permease n=1 Tax=Oenococcus TaxID=46254 RepID=UPI0021E7BF1E|nr:FtsX-like permease family protein [Oenococcus kitaharae]MCV3295986.1 ABC transporter permease [Oenococcus kitaharae]